MILKLFQPLHSKPSYVLHRIRAFFNSNITFVRFQIFLCFGRIRLKGVHRHFTGPLIEFKLPGQDGYTTVTDTWQNIPCVISPGENCVHAWVLRFSTCDAPCLPYVGSWSSHPSCIPQNRSDFVTVGNLKSLGNTYVCVRKTCVVLFIYVHHHAISHS